MTYAQFRTALHGWVCSVTGWDGARVIWRDQNAPPPAEDHIQIQEVSSEALGQGYREVATDGTQTTTLWSISDVEFHGFGGDSRDKLDAVRLALAGVVKREALNTAGLVRRGPVGTIRYVPAIRGTAFEARWILPLRVGMVAQATEDVGYVTTVEYTQEIRDHADEVVDEQVIEITAEDAP